MKTLIVILAVMMMSVLPGICDSVIWDVSGGWGKGFVIKIDNDKQVITLNDRKTDKRYSKKLINGKQLISCIDKLYQRSREYGFDNQVIADASKHRVTLIIDGKKSSKTIAMPKGYLRTAIILNEGVLVKDELAEIESYKKDIDTHILYQFMNVIYKSYFGDIEKQQTQQDTPGKP